MADESITSTPSTTSAASATPRKRWKAMAAPVNEEEAQRRKLFYSELRRHHRAFGLSDGSRVAQEVAAAEREDEAANGQQQLQQQQQNGGEHSGGDAQGGEQQDGEEDAEDTEPHPSELYMELMEDDFGPIEKDDTGFMRNFPKVFATWATFEETLERYTSGTFQIMRTHTTQTTVARNKSTLKYLATQMIPGTFIGHFYPERFEWYKKVLVCAICRASSARQRKLAGHRAGNYGTNKDTDAKVTAQLNPEAENSKHFVIEVTWSGVHNHRCDADELAKFKAGPSRLDDPVLLSLIRKMRKEGKEPRDVKRLIYECTGKKCSTKDVHAIYQRFKSSGGDNDDEEEEEEVEGEENGDEGGGPDDSTFDFFNEHQNHMVAAAPITRNSTITNQSQSMQFDPMTGRLQSVMTTDRNLAVVQQNIARLANSLGQQDQADLANALQVTMFAWTSKRKKPTNTMQNNTHMQSFQSPPPPPPLPLPSVGAHGGMPSFEYRRYDNSNEGADLLMGLDSPAPVFATSGSNGNGRSRQQPQKRRRQ